MMILLSILVIYALASTFVVGVLASALSERTTSMRKLLDALKEVPTVDDDPGVLHVLNDMAKDMQATLRGTTIIAETMVDMRNSQGMQRSPDHYIRSLEYARDKYAATISQKKAINVVISSIQRHGSKK